MAVPVRLGDCRAAHTSWGWSALLGATCEALTVADVSSLASCRPSAPENTGRTATTLFSSTSPTVCTRRTHLSWPACTVRRLASTWHAFKEGQGRARKGKEGQSVQYYGSNWHLAGRRAEDELVEGCGEHCA